MRFDLATLARRQRNIRRSRIVLREISAPATFATNLYQRTYARVVALWQRRIERIMAEYERTLSTMTTDSPADIQRELDEGESEFQRLFMELRPELRDWVLRTEAWSRGKWRGAVLSATGVDLSVMLGPDDVRDTLESYLAWNADLIRDVSNQAKKRVADRVFAGLTQRKPAREVAAEIREAVAMSRTRSMNIAADQLSKISNSLADERRANAGLPIWQWLHSRKKHPREDHRARDGNYYSDDPAMVGKVIDGKTVLAPPDRGDRPGQKPWCGCRSRAVIVWD